ncbi:MAG: adenylyl-sulfate reductase subunit alpha [Clostridium sp.]|nr:adenylyl-sulfate reductase subunit alpha [Clostridium sp.]
MKTEIINTDILIIGGGTAGCYAALTIAEQSPNTKIIIAEKANIKRSGCLAAGVNALNAYITKDHTPDFYVDYAVKDAHGIAREDLLLSISENLNEVTAKMEGLGLVILKDGNGEYVSRGNRNLKINGENFKPILAHAVEKLPNVTVINNLNMIDYITNNGRVTGAYGNSIKEKKLYFISSKATIICTGGAAGLYKPNHPDFSRHKMWYCPFNTGAGYAMGIRAGAEMTTFEMRFIALRCKDTIAPTGTLAQGVGAKQVNALGEIYEDKYGLTTSQRVWGTVAENKAGRGPCYLKTDGITKEQAQDLEKAYLNMAPSQTLKWVAQGKSADEQNVEIEGTEPYIVGGHTASGYWINNDRKTTLDGLYAAGDVAGGCPQKYVTGALAEGKIAALSAVQSIIGTENEIISDLFIKAVNEKVEHYLSNESELTAEYLEFQMQDIMDKYAGGISTHYAFTEESLDTAEEKIKELINLSKNVSCRDMQDLTHFFEVRERLTVCLSVIAHLRARKETRWHCFAENESYPKQDDKNYLKYINSRLVDGEIKIIERPLADRRGKYEYQN